MAIFIAGPDVIAEATGEKISEKDLGGAAVHASTSGNIHFPACTCIATERPIPGRAPAAWT